MKKILISIGLIISYLTGYSQVFVSDGGGSSNIDEAAVGSQISDSLAKLAITVNVLSTADTVFAIHNDSLVAIPVTAITTPLQDDIDSINNVVQNIYTLLSGLGYDLVAPSLDSIVLGGQGPSDYIFRLYFNEQLNQDSVPSHLDFTVTENGNAFNLSSSGVSNNVVTVSGATPAYGNNYLLSYAKGDTAIQDSAGNKVANWNARSVISRLPEPEPGAAPLFLTTDAYTRGWYIAAAENITTSGSEVILWDDVSGNNRDLDRVNGANGPVYTTGDSISFEQDDAIVTIDMDYSQPIMIYAVIKQYAYVLNSNLISLTEEAPYMRLAQTNTGNNNVRIIAGGVYGTATPDWAFNQWSVVRILFNGENSKLIIDDNSPVFVTGGEASSSGLFLKGNIRIKELIIRTVEDSSQDEESVYSYLKNKYGL